VCEVALSYCIESLSLSHIYIYIDMGINVRGVPRFIYELAEIFWRFPNEFAMIRTRYRCKIIKVGNQPVHGRIDRQYGRLRHHNLGYLPSQFFDFRQVAEGTRNRAKMLLG
jgi:hypothetical protein